MKEIFKDIVGYEGRYKVSNFGNIYSTPKDGKPNKMLKQEIMQSKYKRVTLSIDGKVKRFSVHRLVAEAFIDNNENKPCVNHIDNNGLNNNVDNLEWCTHSENMIHAQKQGRLFSSQSKGGNKGKLKHIARAKKEIEESKGVLFGYWKSHGEYIRNDNGKYKIKCSCTLCENEYYVEKSALFTISTKSCVNCANSIRRNKGRKI